MYAGNLEYGRDANSDQQVKDELFTTWHGITNSSLLKMKLDSYLTPN